MTTSAELSTTIRSERPVVWEMDQHHPEIVSSLGEILCLWPTGRRYLDTFLSQILKTWASSAWVLVYPCRLSRAPIARAGVSAPLARSPSFVREEAAEDR